MHDVRDAAIFRGDDVDDLERRREIDVGGARVALLRDAFVSDGKLFAR
jgi:hypothetical protein